MPISTENARVGTSDRGARLLGPGFAQIEKWYIDVLLPDESVLIVYLLGMRLAGIHSAKVALEWSPPDGRAERATARARGMRRTPEGVDFGLAETRGPNLTIHAPGLSAALEFKPRHGPVRLVHPVHSSRSAHSSVHT
mgnify:CR=1 FL=1